MKPTLQQHQTTIKNHYNISLLKHIRKLLAKRMQKDGNIECNNVELRKQRHRKTNIIQSEND